MSKAILTRAMYDAMEKHRDAFLQQRTKGSSTARERAWRDRLTTAWLNDYAEQRGFLRTIRNTIGIQEALSQFASMRETFKHAESLARPNSDA